MERSLADPLFSHFLLPFILVFLDGTLAMNSKIERIYEE